MSVSSYPGSVQGNVGALEWFVWADREEQSSPAETTAEYSVRARQPALLKTPKSLSVLSGRCLALYKNQISFAWCHLKKGC